MASIREQIMEAVRVTLDTHPDKPAGVSVERYRTRALEPRDLPITVIFPATEEAIDRIANAKSYELEINIEHRIALASAQIADQVLDPLLIYTIKALDANQNLGGVSEMITELATDWDAAGGEVEYAAARQTFLVSYRTQLGDPEVLP